MANNGVPHSRRKRCWRRGWSGATVVAMGFLAHDAQAGAPHESHRPGTHPAPVFGEAQRSRADVLARRLWRDLRCICEQCEGQTLEHCEAAGAAEERERILAFLQGRDLSTKEARRASYDAAIADYAARMGVTDVLVTSPRQRLLTFLVLLLGAGAAVAAVKVFRRRFAAGEDGERAKRKARRRPPRG